MTQATTIQQQPHPDFTQGTQVHKQPHYICPDNYKTKGEKIYDFMNYFTIGYAVNLALSVAVTEYFLHGGGNKAYQAVDHTLTKALGTMVKPQTAKTVSADATKYLLLTTGGTILMAPMLWAENRKSKLVYLANRALAPNVIAEDDPYKNMSTMEILSDKFDENNLAQPVNEQPKHGIGNATWRRSLSVGIIIGWGTMLGRTIGSSYFEDKGMKMLEAGKNLPGLYKLNELTKTSAKAERWTRWTFTDIVNTAITTGVIWLTNGAHAGATSGKNGHNQTENADTHVEGNNEHHVTYAKAIETKQTPDSQVREPEVVVNHAPDVSKTAPNSLVAQASHVDGLDKRDHAAEASLSA